MTTTDFLLIGALIVALASFVYIWFGAKRLRDSHNSRVGYDPERELPPERPAWGGRAEPTATAQPSPTAPLTVPAEAAEASPFLAAPEGPADDLSRIKGIGPKLSARLAELGVFHYAQIAAWTPEQLAMVDAQLGTFQGRPARDQWQAQARLLAAGDLKAYERAHGKLEPGQPGTAA
jgi:predicted flap endonuclease-1-like 5' DNA nuclease